MDIILEKDGKIAELQAQVPCLFALYNNFIPKKCRVSLALSGGQDAQWCPLVHLFFLHVPFWFFAGAQKCLIETNCVYWLWFHRCIFIQVCFPLLRTFPNASVKWDAKYPSWRIFCRRPVQSMYWQSLRIQDEYQQGNAWEWKKI